MEDLTVEYKDIVHDGLIMFPAPSKNGDIVLHYYIDGKKHRVLNVPGYKV